MKRSYIKPDICSEKILSEVGFLDLVSSGQIQDLELIDDTWG